MFGMLAMQLGQPFVVSYYFTMVGGLDVVSLARVVRGVFRMQLVQSVVLVSHSLVVLGCLGECLLSSCLISFPLPSCFLPLIGQQSVWERNDHTPRPE
jgi:hypothetical protein